MILTSTSPVHFDASFLIRALLNHGEEASALDRWLDQRREFAMSTLAWGEFLCGPLAADEEARARRVVRVWVPIGIAEATAAARLFNDTGRRRGSFQDCIIAATAMRAGVALATADVADFERFRPLGLELAS